MPNIQNQEDRILDLRFSRYRKRSGRYGKILMYFGYYLMITESLGILINIIKLTSIFSGTNTEVRYDEKEDLNKPFSQGQIVISTSINILAQCLGVLTAYYLVKATKIPVRQIST